MSDSTPPSTKAPRELHVTIMQTPERGIVYDMAKCDPEIFIAPHLTKLAYVRKEAYDQAVAERDDWEHTAFENERIIVEKNTEIERVKKLNAGAVLTATLIEDERDEARAERLFARDKLQTTETLLRERDDELAKARAEVANLKMVCRRLSAAKTIEVRDRIARQCFKLFEGDIAREALGPKGEE